MGRPRKGRPYSGVLKKRPRFIGFEGLEAPEIVTTAACIFNISEAEWLAAIERRRQRDRDELLSRIQALAEHYDVDQTCRGWETDLLLHMARQHHPECMVSGLPRISVLFAKYNADPYAPDAEFKLILALARVHVDAFKPAKDDSSTSKEDLDGIPRTQLSDPEIAKLVIADLYLSRTVKSARQRRAILRDRQKKRLLREAVGEKLAIEVNSILVGKDGRKGRSDSWLKGFFSDLEHALDDFRAGKANRLQVQFIGGVIPLVFRPPKSGGQSTG